MSRHPDRRRTPVAGIDLSQFYQVFFEEAGENLDQHGADAARRSTSTPPTTRS